MILRSTFKVTPLSAASEIDLPWKIDLPDDSTIQLTEKDGELQLVRELPVRGPLEVEEESGWHEELPDGSRKKLPRLRLPRGFDSDGDLVDDVIDGLSFLIDKPLNIRSAGRSQLVPENQADRKQLKAVGSDEPYTSTGGVASIRTVSLEVNVANVKALMDGPRVGVRLYADALRLLLDTSRFRELWKVLESAFNSKGKALVKLVASYEPAKKMGFDESELEHLRQLRGRAGHAETGTPDKEFAYVESECSKLLPRLQCLAERIILTKKSWGVQSGGVGMDAPPMKSYVGKGGGVVLITDREVTPKDGSE